MTVLTDTQVVTASGGLVELGYSQITTTVVVSSTTEGTAGTTVIPALTVVCDGSPILVEFVAHRVQTGSNTYVVTNLITDGANQGRITFTQSTAAGVLNTDVYGAFRLTPSAGSHTFAITAFRGTSDGEVHNDSNGRAFLRVSKIVQATQWPAVTTGSIICTSSTRPASPFAGQQIYETDTSKMFVWNGSAWQQIAVDGTAVQLSTLTVTGYTSSPTRPTFSASATSGLPGGYWTNYNEVTANVGNHFNTTTGIFTAPTAGYYFFVATGFKENGAAAPTQYYIRVNAQYFKRSYDDSPAGYYAATPGTHGVFLLAVNDTVGIYQTTGTMHPGTNMHFSGWMLG